MNNHFLLNEISKDDSKAFTKLYELYWSQVFEFTRLYILLEEDSEEIVQEVFIKLWENRKTLYTIRNFDSYLFIMTRNMIFNFSRQKMNRNFLKITIDEAINLQAEDNTLNTIIYKDLQIYIKQLIEELPPRQKEVFKLSREEKMTYKEIASLLKITPKTVERNISEALKKIRKQIPLVSLMFFFLHAN